mmetsp:Transcript_28735/g.63278  ORF Transcript_28735/g.63278 Transcript_28735/m.63278 type:complete len:321 (+) Transcript_28735:280-1242(+)|eukprot:CAMPEP_0202894862 /NCGR_PEP_ID=MMETSP1392-20130828/4161_1 /ASSEMBLY_ACC=CAM_ASM_000868 /TAXON_ID=225041 /ORGANISM="Chlamydomonas chlamydogama, Strain SAG 11-48b" /LENGTH=320 /DNA_ID=CAMNT_0049579679 /DNA_START=201 /DNA_END=1163 /DNA_ORIENTATION=+
MSVEAADPITLATSSLTQLYNGSRVLSLAGPDYLLIQLPLVKQGASLFCGLVFTLIWAASAPVWFYIAVVNRVPAFLLPGMLWVLMVACCVHLTWRAWLKSWSPRRLLLTADNFKWCHMKCPDPSAPAQVYYRMYQGGPPLQLRQRRVEADDEGSREWQDVELQYMDLRQRPDVMPLLPRQHNVKLLRLEAYDLTQEDVHHLISLANPFLGSHSATAAAAMAAAAAMQVSHPYSTIQLDCVYGWPVPSDATAGMRQRAGGPGAHMQAGPGAAAPPTAAPASNASPGAPALSNPAAATVNFSEACGAPASRTLHIFDGMAQ